jgi:hypothetical protein
MRFIYRGVYYDQVPSSLEVTEGKAGGHYRGAVWRCRTLAETPMSRTTPSTPSKLTYRGIVYSPSAPTAADSPAVVTQHTLLHRTCPKVVPSLLPQVQRLHRSNICRNIERRLEVAKAQGNDDLVALLEREFETTACPSGH